MKRKRFRNRKRKEEIAWMIVSALTATAAAYVVEGALRASWKAARGTAPPTNAARHDVTWRDAISWSVGAGVVMGLSRVFVQRGAAAGWERVTGKLPPL